MDFAQRIIFACFQRCHRSKWHVFENADVCCFLARTGCTFICGVVCLEPSLGAHAPSRAEMMEWFSPPLARVPSEVKVNQAEIKSNSLLPTIAFAFICSESVFTGHGNLRSFSLDH